MMCCANMESEGVTGVTLVNSWFMNDLSVGLVGFEPLYHHLGLSTI
jgi:hypothetical protein